MSVVTAHEARDPFLFVEFTDGRLTTLQLHHTMLDRSTTAPDTVSGTVTAVVREALVRHEADLVADVEAGREDKPSRAETESLAFLTEVLGNVDNAPFPAPTITVTGRGASGDVAVEAGVEGIALINIPEHLLHRDDQTAVERAIVAATNQALEQVEAELMARLENNPPAEDLPSWEHLVDAVITHRRTEYR